eukprot:40528-Rhodomonas_salina.2
MSWDRFPHLQNGTDSQNAACQRSWTGKRNLSDFADQLRLRGCILLLHRHDDEGEYPQTRPHQIKILWVSSAAPLETQKIKITVDQPEWFY